MAEKFIALRRSPHKEAATEQTHSVAETRTVLVEAAQQPNTTEQLERIGLQVLDPCEHNADGDNSLWPLCYLDAFVVDADDPQVVTKARRMLQPEYMIVPNAELVLAAPERGRLYRRLPQRDHRWPEVSGVELAHAQENRGQGTLVCVLDTGVDADHVELRRKVIDFRYIPLDPRSGVMRTVRGFDVDGHGTHVSGIIGGRNVGIAPEADLMVAAVLESETLRTSLERVVVALNWVLAQFEDPANRDKPVIVNMSLGFLHASLDRTDLESPVQGLQKVLSTLLDEFHVLPVCAVGNEGVSSVRAPAYFSDTLSVGAVDWDLQVAGFSGGGKSPLSGEIEPNLVGYGVDVLSSFERTIYNRSLYRKMSGTSMAAPYVTGIAALHAAQDPGLQGRALWDHMVKTALPLDVPPDRGGAGLARFV
ncbi:MAG: S8 family serine peptidase [Caldilineaceae bacterium]